MASQPEATRGRGPARNAWLIVGCVVGAAAGIGLCVAGTAFIAWERWWQRDPAIIADAPQQAGDMNGPDAGEAPRAPDGNPAVAINVPERPVAARQDITPAPLKADREECRLPAPAGDICAGGGGRFLIVHVPKQRQLAVFDANEGRIVKYLALAEDNVLLAAGLDQLIVAVPARNALQRWSLRTFERELTVFSPLAEPIQALAMGAATRGPLVIGSGNERMLLDPQTFKESPLRFDGADGPGLGAAQAPLRVSADGRIIAGADGGWLLEGNTYQRCAMPGGALPDPEGRTVYTAGRLYTAHGKPLGEQLGGHGKMVWYLPAVEGSCYLALHQVRKDGRPYRDTLRVDVHLTGEPRPIAALPFVEALDTLTDWTFGVPPFERHVYLIPDAKLLVIVPNTRDRLVLHRFDLDALLAKSSVDYLVVQSQPVTRATKGQTYAYPLAVRAKKGGIKVQIDAGPDGMRVTPEGKLTWAVPADWRQPEVDVILTVSDATGQEILHAFQIAVR